MDLKNNTFFWAIAIMAAVFSIYLLVFFRGEGIVQFEPGVYGYCNDKWIEDVQCNPPGVNFDLCTQDTVECEDSEKPKAKVRGDTLGNCNDECKCIKDSFTLACVGGECGAKCGSDSDCNSIEGLETGNGQICNLNKCECGCCAVNSELNDAEKEDIIRQLRGSGLREGVYSLEQYCGARGSVICEEMDSVLSNSKMQPCKFVALSDEEGFGKQCDIGKAEPGCCKPALLTDEQKASFGNVNDWNVYCGGDMPSRAKCDEKYDEILRMAPCRWVPGQCPTTSQPSIVEEPEGYCGDGIFQKDRTVSPEQCDYVNGVGVGCAEPTPVCGEGCVCQAAEVTTPPATPPAIPQTTSLSSGGSSSGGRGGSFSEPTTPVPPKKLPLAIVIPSTPEPAPKPVRPIVAPPTEDKPTHDYGSVGEIRSLSEEDSKKPVPPAVKINTPPKTPMRPVDSRPPKPVCGNGKVEKGEECDINDKIDDSNPDRVPDITKPNLNGKTCKTEKGYTGTLKCDGGCGFDTKDCTCGDKKINGKEVCDGKKFDGKTCKTEKGSNYEGDLICADDCKKIDSSACKIITSKVGIVSPRIVVPPPGE